MSAITYKSKEDITFLRESAQLVGKTLGQLKKWIVPGASTLKLDQIAEEFIRDNGGRPAFKNYKPDFSETAFPFSLCISINEEVVHGMASQERTLENGDIVSVDCGVEMNGYYGDSAYTFGVGEVSAKKRRLMEVTKESLYKGIEKAIVGNRMGEVSNAIQRHAEMYGYSVVKEMVGHGVGKHLHEPPEVPNYGSRRSGIRLQEGLVIAIEPMINMGKRHIKIAEDGWTVFASDHLPSAHYEHTVVVQDGKPDVLTTFAYIEN